MFPNRLRQLREDAGLTQARLAKMLNLTQSTIAYYESGKKTPTLENAKVIAKLFNVSLDYLFEISNDKDGIDDIGKDEIISVADKLSNDINKLSPKSQKDLENYINLLKLRDIQDRNYKDDDELATLD